MGLPKREPAKHEPIEKARVTTDTKLHRERERADRALARKAGAVEDQIDRAIDRTRAQADAKLESSRAEARSVAREVAGEMVAEVAAEVEQATPGAGRAVADEARAKAEATVEKVVDRAEAAVDRERGSVDKLTEVERAARKRAFIEILAAERHDTDVSLECERQQSDKLVSTRDDVLAMISHDLRNLIQAMQLKAHLILRHLPKDESLPRKLAGEIEKSCSVMAKWAGDLVDLTNLDSGGLELHPTACDPGSILDESVDAYRAKATTRGIQLSASKDARPHPPIWCDHDRVVQVLLNLLDNATKFTPPGGTIVAACEPCADGVMFSVVDSGAGVSEADQERIFERHVHTSIRSGGGTGLGLYICKVGSSRVDLQACKLEYSIVSPK